MLQPFARGGTVAIALSGGADSMALVLLADAWAKANGSRIVALTVDHRLREESTDEASQVAAWMRARGLTHHILTPEHRDVSSNLQETARVWRYDALAEFCSNNAILHCLLAHQAGDARETAALNVARGETAEGPSGMSRARNYRGVRFLRPLLDFERGDLEEFLRAQGAAWVEDPSNSNTRFARVRMRQAMAEDAANHAARDAEMLQQMEARAARDDAFARVAMQLVKLDPLGFAEFLFAAWQKLEGTMQSRLLADCLTTISGAIHRPRAHETVRLVGAMQQDFRAATLQHCAVSMRKGVVRIARELARVEGAVELSGKGVITWDKRFRVRYDLSGAYVLKALGNAGRKQLAGLADLPAATPSLWHLDELVFVPHIMPTPPAMGAVTIGFAPAKPLAAAPFWWFNSDHTF